MIGSQHATLSFLSISKFILFLLFLSFRISFVLPHFLFSPCVSQSAILNFSLSLSHVSASSPSRSPSVITSDVSLSLSKSRSSSHLIPRKLLKFLSRILGQQASSISLFPSHNSLFLPISYPLHFLSLFLPYISFNFLYDLSSYDFISPAFHVHASIIILLLVFYYYFYSPSIL